MQNLRQAIRLRTRLNDAIRPPLQLSSRWLLKSRLRSGRLSSYSRAALLAIYRYKNASILLPLVDEARSKKWEVCLWALDEIHQSLASLSLGVGLGSKFSLLNSMLGTRDWSGLDWVIVADDDVTLETGSLGLLLDTAQEAGISLAQPAHSHLSYRSHEITLLAPFSIVRLTTFVECGPLFAIHRSLANQILPFPAGSGMWGLDIRWTDLARAGARLGIVDVVAMRHLKPVGSDYSASIEFQRAQGLLRERGVQSVVELQRTLGVWRPWQRCAPWAG